MVFAIHALSEYYLATKIEESKNFAISLFLLIESKGKDKKGYLEEFDKKGNPKPDEMLTIMLIFSFF